MKKLITVFLVTLLLLSLAVPAYGAEEPLDYVVDYAGLLTSGEEEMLQQLIHETMPDLQLDIVIVTTYGTGGNGVQAYADDFYDQNGYGYGADHAGILLLLDMESREWYMRTSGDAIYIFTDYGLEELGQSILPYLSDGDYSGAFSHWIGELSYYVERFRNGSPVDGYVQPDEYDSPYGDVIYYYDDHVGIKPFPIALIIGLAAALITVLVMRSRMNTARMQSGAGDYMKEGSFHLRQFSDVFLYSRVTRVAKPKNTSGGGGSSVHRSSGGVSHGGRGGRF